MRSLSQHPVPCEVCGRPSARLHYGALTCRACAAFFRRSRKLENANTCIRGTGKCAIRLADGFYNCKKCRLRKCLEVGMVRENFQTDVEERLSRTDGQIVPTVNTFLGRPNLIIFSVRSPNIEESPRNFIDVKHLIDKAMLILEQGIESPVHSKTALGKLAFGLQRVQSSQQMPDFRALKRYGKVEALTQWECGFLRVVKWLTYFDEFRQLPKGLQVSMIKSVWSTWNRLISLADTANMVRKLFSETEIKKMTSDTVVSDWSGMEIDMSWCSKYPVEQIKFFLDIPTQWKMDDLTRLMVELNPTDVEFAYMLCQLSFHYMSEKHPERVQSIVEKFGENLANDLHEYYVEELNTPRYVDRLMSMMKINNQVQQIVRRNRSKTELALVLEVVNCDCSHPEMFMDM